MSDLGANSSKSGGQPIKYIIGGVIVIAIGYFMATSFFGEKAPPPQAVVEEPVLTPEEMAEKERLENLPPVSAQDSQVQPDWY